MKRLLIAAALTGLFTAASRAEDVVTYVNRDARTGAPAEEKAKGGLISEETPAKVTYKAGNKTQEIPAADIIEVDYDTRKVVDRPTWRHPVLRQDAALKATKVDTKKEAFKEALDAYKKLAPEVAQNKMLHRHVQFKIAEVQAQLADADPSQADAAVEALKKFKADFGNGWQLVKATKLLVRLLEQKGDEAGAQAVYEELAANEAAPKEVRQEFGLLAVRYLLRKGKPDDAATKAKALQKDLPKDDPQAMKIQVYLSACDIAARKYDGAEKELKAVVEGGADNDVKALARNTLGDYYRARGDGEQAFWQYLWVDVYYNQDREELAKALYHLSKLFAEVKKDTTRAKECLDRLLGDEKQFGTTEYYKKAVAEKSASSGEK
jgi:hypothetical protein